MYPQPQIATCSQGLVGGAAFFAIEVVDAGQPSRQQPLLGGGELGFQVPGGVTVHDVAQRRMRRLAEDPRGVTVRGADDLPADRIGGGCVDADDCQRCRVRPYGVSVDAGQSCRV